MKIRNADNTVMTITNHLYAFSGIRFTRTMPIHAPRAMAGNTNKSMVSVFKLMFFQTSACNGNLDRLMIKKNQAVVPIKLFLFR